MDPRNLPKRTTPHFSLYQRECFESGTKDGKLPPFNTHVGICFRDLEALNLIANSCDIIAR